MHVPLRVLGLLCVVDAYWAYWVAGANSAAAQSPASQVNISEPSHVLAPGEFVQIKVFQEPDLDTAVRIPGDGRINFPLIGEVALAGQSVQQVTRTIKDRLQARFLVNPQVSIAVLEPAKRLFTVLGQVQRPGTYRFPEQQELDLLQVIGIAGGYTRLADPGRIVVKRRIAGSEKIIRLDGKRLARGEIGEPFPVRTGDVITVGERLF
jgi:protein involved in polysaccharide export with SLBB domain